MTQKRLTETELQRRIIERLRAHGIWVMRMGVSRKRGSQGTQSGEAGMPDLWTPFCWIEVKLPGAELGPEQVKWHARARRYGVHVVVATTEQQIERVREFGRFA